MLAVVALVNAGTARRPAPQAYLQHREWRKIWVHLFEQSGLTVADENTTLRLIQGMEEALFGGPK